MESDGARIRTHFRRVDSAWGNSFATRKKMEVPDPRLEGLTLVLSVPLSGASCLTENASPNADYETPPETSACPPTPSLQLKRRRP